MYSRFVFFLFFQSNGDCRNMRYSFQHTRWIKNLKFTIIWLYCTVLYDVYTLSSSLLCIVWREKKFNFDNQSKRTSTGTKTVFRNPQCALISMFANINIYFKCHLNRILITQTCLSYTHTNTLFLSKIMIILIETEFIK